MALPNPFQSAIVAPAISPSIAKTDRTAQNDTSFFHGYRSTFNIDQQKEQYQQQKIHQQQQHQQQHQHQNHYQQNTSKHQPNQFKRNFQHHGNHQPNRNAAAAAPAPHSSNGTVNAGFVSNWCDLCERGFKFPHQLEKHRSEHEKCWFENCTFEGHTQLLKKHIEMQHQSGLFQRIAKIETDEDIEKWREERRKRYPTASNIEARRQAQEERLKRGERINEPTSRFGSGNNRKRAQQHRSLTTAKPNESIEPSVTIDVSKKRNDHKHRRRTRQRNKTNRLAKKEGGKTANESETTQNETAATTTSMEIASNVAISPAKAEKMAQNSSALASIMGMYGSDSDSNDNEDDHNDVVTNAMPAMTATDATKVIEGKTDENACLQEADPVDKDDKLTAIESSVSQLEIEDEVNLKRPADAAVDELPNKQSKLDSDVLEQFKQNMAIESDDDAPDEQPIQRQSQVSLDTDEMEVASGPTKTKPMTTTTATSQKLTNERMPKRKTILDTTRKIRSQNTLLEKLLQKDIRHERNVLLQCVRYVVEQNFFGIGQTSNKQNDKANSL